MRVKNIIVISIYLLILLIPSQGIVKGQTTGKTYVFEPATGYSFTGIVTGSVLWEEGIGEQITLNLTMINYPTNLSKIDLNYIDIAMWGDRQGQDTQLAIGDFINPEFSLTHSNRSYFTNRTYSPPNEVDSFYFKISLNVQTTGGVSSESQTLEMRFPDENKILISRNRLNQLVQLYGFPPTSFFRSWFPYYLLFIGFLVTPAMIVGVSKVVNRKEGTKFQQKTENVEVPTK